MPDLNAFGFGRNDQHGAERAINLLLISVKLPSQYVSATLKTPLNILNDDFIVFILIVHLCVYP